MIDADAFQRLVQVFETINNSLEESDDNAPDANEFFEELKGKKDKQIELFDDKIEEVKTKSISEFAGYQERWPCVAGLDSSNTRTIRLDSGEVATASLATFGIDGDSRGELRQTRTVNAVVFSLNPDFQLQDIDIQDTKRETIEMLQLPREMDTGQIESWVQGISLLHSEFIHPETVQGGLDIPLLIDGPIYSGNFFWFSRYQHNQMNTNTSKTLGTPLNKWDGKLLELLQNRINTIEHYYENNLPLASIVKTTTSSAVLDSIKEEISSFSSNLDKDDIRWYKDMTFFNELLRDRDNKEPTVSYTPWMKERYTVVSGDRVEFFKNNKQVDLELHEKEHGLGFDAYKRAFFYLRVPYNNYCLRVEAPAGLVHKLGDEIRDLVLYQVSADKGIPGPIVFADSRAEISEETRKKLKKELRYSRSTDNYNEKRGYYPRSKTGRE